MPQCWPIQGVVKMIFHQYNSTRNPPSSKEHCFLSSLDLLRPKISPLKYTLKPCLTFFSRFLIQMRSILQQSFQGLASTVFSTVITSAPRLVMPEIIRVRSHGANSQHDINIYEMGLQSDDRRHSGSKLVCRQKMQCSIMHWRI